MGINELRNSIGVNDFDNILEIISFADECNLIDEVVSQTFSGYNYTPENQAFYLCLGLLRYYCGYEYQAGDANDINDFMYSELYNKLLEWINKNQFKHITAVINAKCDWQKQVIISQLGKNETLENLDNLILKGINLIENISQFNSDNIQEQLPSLVDGLQKLTKIDENTIADRVIEQNKDDYDELAAREAKLKEAFPDAPNRASYDNPVEYMQEMVKFINNKKESMIGQIKKDKEEKVVPTNQPKKKGRPKKSKVLELEIDKNQMTVDDLEKE